MSYRRLTRLIVIALAVAVAAPTLLAVYVYQYGQADRAAPADVIIILGAGTRPSGAPSPGHTRRIRHGVALYQEGLAPWILCTGGYTDRHPNSEAHACATLARNLGVPDSAILLEENSSSTEENAIEARRVMDEHGLETAIVVSDNYHLLRAELLFGAQGIPVTVSPAQATAGPLYWRTALTNMYREVAALGWYVFKTALGLPHTSLK
jgi:uncharacterized SAM-binding protein YcdF (DUF218 family)